MIKVKFLFLLVTISIVVSYSFYESNPGDPIDYLHGVPVYYNGKSFRNSYGRNIASDGYNLGLKYQCVEFVKRFYYEHYNHKMPHSSGNAKDYFDKSLPDVGFNSKRGLMQYRNIREQKPKAGDILIYDSYPGNPYGHIAIIADVKKDSVQIVQQNMGKKSRDMLPLVEFMGYYTVADYYVLGWLRKE